MSCPYSCFLSKLMTWHIELETKMNPSFLQSVTEAEVCSEQSCTRHHSRMNGVCWRPFLLLLSWPLRGCLVGIGYEERNAFRKPIFHQWQFSLSDQILRLDEHAEVIGIAVTTFIYFSPQWGTGWIYPYMEFWQLSVEPHLFSLTVYSAITRAICLQ